MMIDVQRIAGGYNELGIKLPEDADQALDAFRVAQEYVHSADDTLDNDVRAGKVGAKNIAARLRDAALDQAARDNVGRLIGDVIDPALSSRAMKAFSDDHPRLLTELAPRYEEAMNVVSVASDIVGVNRYNNPASILELGPQASGAFHAAQEALPTLEAIRRLLGKVTGRILPAQTVGMFVTIDDEHLPDTFDMAVTAWDGPHRWIALAGVPHVTPKLGTPDDADALARRAHAARPIPVAV
jgi:hypothetical protein